MNPPGRELPWHAVEAMLDGMLGRRYYTNHGPLAVQLEAAVGRHAGVAHAVVACNAAIGLVMLLEALGLSGQVLLAVDAPAWLAQAVGWAGLRVRRCDVDAAGALTTGSIAAARAPDCTGVICTPDDDLTGLDGLAVCVVGWSGPGSSWPALVPLPGVADGPRVGCILTDDAVLAGRLRNIRSSYGAGAPVAVRRTANGRVSEAQAGLALAGMAEMVQDATGARRLGGR